MTDIPLERVPGWSAGQIAQMKKAWITTAEQVVALSATPGGVHSLAEQLNLSDEQAQQLVALTRAELNPATRAEMEKVVDHSQRGLGVRRPGKQE